MPFHDQLGSLLGGNFANGLGISMSIMNGNAAMDWARMGAGFSRAVAAMNAKLKEQQGAIALKEMDRSNQRHAAAINTGYAGAGVVASGTALDVAGAAMMQGYENYRRLENQIENSVALAEFEGEMAAWQQMAEGTMGQSEAYQDALGYGIQMFAT